MFNWFNMKKKSLPEQVLQNTKDIEKLFDEELSDITQLNYKQDAEDSLTYADGKATFKGKMSIIRNENTQNLVVDSDIEVNISSGDEDIIIDAGEDNVSLKIRLDNETRNKINRALLTPITTPSEREFVAIGTNNSQVMIPESEIDDKINLKENIFEPYINSIDIGGSILTQASEFFDLFGLDKTKTYKFQAGTSAGNNFNNLLPEHSIFGGYAVGYIRYYAGSPWNNDTRLECYEIIILNQFYKGRIGKCYMYKDLENIIRFTNFLIIE